MTERFKPLEVQVIENKQIVPDHYILSFKSKEIASRAKPGQFVQIQVQPGSDPLLARPFSFLDIKGSVITILYQVVGKGTEILSKKSPKDSLVVLGPLGNGWGHKTPLDDELWLLVGGGVGIPPLFHLAKQAVKSHPSSRGRIRVFLGGRSKNLLHSKNDFKKLKLSVDCSTDDGSFGLKGLVTEILDDYIDQHVGDYKKIKIFTCGPTPMLKGVSALAQKYDIECLVSVEEPMPCGFGVCLGCAIKVYHEEEPGFKYALSCVDGPVFDSQSVVWNEN